MYSKNKQTAFLWAKLILSELNKNDEINNLY